VLGIRQKGFQVYGGRDANAYANTKANLIVCCK
jgi:hypothetical protein